ncbi:hypothetical protein AR457_21160 [Streptomyces agglomeratus]|uniref:Uncharacterized protein n=1 Tax=Streptomyces agglomeratus TaxID=285458 RepID=A0A1E5PB36_9ACTN|nr:hypothetical protein [Streptomyces agglomeratus]OEJ26584.1 hypothetical protein AS594_20910 [Streptomyces agglomeratus]OEJ39348.1 hypothetical protein BGK70_15495 [Streptomyces agglomeratus]OEJ46268.1 hypothetical protein AR457_21160 [Streptomyces agglomeratus]OEJ51867.1 hypothetical protein BGK72_14935 [Streptomyces agglomeratus]OEJ59274.1 hypothetical protein BGM19_16050 [Streptomyces agglomeratus]
MRAPRFNPLHLAGWLFADMLLVLALVAMGDQGDPLAAEAAVKPSASASAKPKRPPKAPKHTGPRAVVNKPVKVSIDAAPGDKRRIEQRLRAVTAPHKDRRAAFVLTFGHHAEPGPGGEYAHEVNSLLKKARPGMFEGATTRDFWKGGTSAGHADIEIYFYTY